MAFKWVYIGNIMGPPGDAAALGRFDALDAAIRSMQQGLLVGAEDSTYAIPFVDQDGRIAGGFTQSGQMNLEKPLTVQGGAGVAFQPVDNTEYAFSFTDKDGYLALGIKTDGTVVFGRGGQAGPDAISLANDAVGLSKTLRNKVACIGDSLTDGFYGGVGGQNADAWPAKLKALVPADVSVYNLGTNGFTVDEVAVRIGAIRLPLTAAGGSIPASGGVTVVTTAVIGWRPSGTTRSIKGSLAGVPGTLTRSTSDTSFTFTRTTSGSLTPVTAGTTFIPDQAGHDAETLVILLGRNNVSYGVSGTDPTVAEHVVAGIGRIVAWQSRQLKQVLILGNTTTTNETSGTAGYATVTEINTRLANKYGPRFYDLRRYLVDKAIYDLGITPTATDLTKMASDTLPPSIMDGGSGGTGDTTHWSKATASLVAARVNDYLTTRDWILP